jgi:protein SCO1
MRRLYLIIFGLMGVCFTATGVYVWPWQTVAEERSGATKPKSHWGKDYLPNLPVVDQDGNAYNFYDDLIKGKRVVISFIYTTCTDICPLTTARMVMLQEKLGSMVGRDVYFYSITIDPEHDGPAELKKYMEAFHVGPGWRFLTGKPRDIAQIRYKLGERSRTITEHRHEMLLGNEPLEDWTKDSGFSDLDRVAMNVRSMDPNWRNVATQSIPTNAMPADVKIEEKPGGTLFIKMCAMCHTIGHGDRVGPDLKHVTSRRDRQWLTQFISAPDKMFARRDPVALELAAKYPAVRMPTVGLSEQDALDVMGFIEAQSNIAAAAANPAPALEQSQKK